MEMPTTTINYARFAVLTYPAVSFWKKYQRTDVKFHDSDGFFGALRYDYFSYVSRAETDRVGFSKGLILLHTKKSLEKMNELTKESVAKRMKDGFDIDISGVEKDDMVIVAEDHGSIMTQNSMNIVFSRRDEEE
jgi:hypothetical protein